MWRAQVFKTVLEMSVFKAVDNRIRHYGGRPGFVIIPGDQEHRSMRSLDWDLGLQGYRKAPPRQDIRRRMPLPSPRVWNPQTIAPPKRTLAGTYATTALMFGYMEPNCSANSPTRQFPTTAIRSATISGRCLIHASARPKYSTSNH